jgi:hypothetical protein
MDPLSTFRERFGAPRALVGMLHVGALPGTPAARHPIDRLIEHTVAEALIYRDAGFTALALEGLPVAACLDRAVVSASFAIEAPGAAALLEASRADADIRIRQWSAAGAGL